MWIWAKFYFYFSTNFFFCSRWQSWLGLILVGISFRWVSVCVIAINLSSDHWWWYFKLCVVPQIFPHSSQLNWANIATILCFRRCTGIGQKLIFFGEMLCLRKFSRGKFFRASTHGILILILILKEALSPNPNTFSESCVYKASVGNFYVLFLA